MDEELALSALKLERSAFVDDLPRWFLIVPVENVAQPSVRFRTAASQYVKELASFAHGSAESERPSLKSPRWNRQPWDPMPLQKRRVPYPDRISIGRAPNVDVVIHSRFVSKLHAHVTLPEGENPTLTDLDSQNGTFLNGERLIPRARTTIANGDILSLGEVHCELATSDVLYYALRRKYLLLLAPTSTPAVGGDDEPQGKTGA